MRRPGWELSIAFLAVCAVGFAAWIASNKPQRSDIESENAARPTISEEIALDAEPADSLSAPPSPASLSGFEPHSIVAQSDSPWPASLGVMEPPPALPASEAPAQVIVCGRVRGPVRDLTQIRIELHAGPSSRESLQAFDPFELPLRPAVDASGHFEVDALSLLRCDSGFDLAREIHVVALHPLCTGAFETLRVPELTAHLAPPSDPSAREVVLDVALELRLGTLVSGRVRVAGAAPKDAVAVAATRLAIFERETFERRALERIVGHALSDAERQRLETDRSLPVWRLLSLDPGIEANADGTFELHVLPGARYAVVAAARGLRPRTQVLDVTAEGRYELEFE